VRAAVYRGRCDIRIENVAEPVPARGELLLRIAATGICGTDGHEYARGPSQFAVPSRSPWGPPDGLIPGHEFAGTVIGVGQDAVGFREGDLVASGSGVACGECHWCRRGRTNLCVRYETVGLQRHGGLAEFCTVPARSCALVDQSTLTADAAALGQPMAIAVHAAERGKPASGMDVLVIGAGGIGTFLIYALAESGARVSVLETDPARRDLAVRLGAAVALRPPPAQELPGAIGAQHAPEVIYEVTGNPAGLTLALAALAAGVRLVLIGLQGSPAAVDLRRVSISECELIGTNALIAATDLPKALELLGRRAESWTDVAPVALALEEYVEEGLRPLAGGTAARVKTLVDPAASASRRSQM
jgi:(R,R)-butanediol dehydrogenase/meso-butanediol dehydrogenase/diacetyl reductase